MTCQRKPVGANKVMEGRRRRRREEGGGVREERLRG